MSWVAGVDGCRAGWIVVLVDSDARSSRRPDAQLCSSFNEVLVLKPTPAIIALDMPIGLPDAPQPGSRICDRQARQHLGRLASSVFSPPDRNLLDATAYEQSGPAV
jgi:threonine dehydratase